MVQGAGITEWPLIQDRLLLRTSSCRALVACLAAVAAAGKAKGDGQELGHGLVANVGLMPYPSAAPRPPAPLQVMGTDRSVQGQRAVAGLEGPLPCGGVLKDLRHPLPPDSAAMYSRTLPQVHCPLPQVAWWCVARSPPAREGGSRGGGGDGCHSHSARPCGCSGEHVVRQKPVVSFYIRFCLFCIRCGALLRRLGPAEGACADGILLNRGSLTRLPHPGDGLPPPLARTGPGSWGGGGLGTQCRPHGPDNPMCLMTLWRHVSAEGLSGREHHGPGTLHFRSLIPRAAPGGWSPLNTGGPDRRSYRGFKTLVAANAARSRWRRGARAPPTQTPSPVVPGTRQRQWQWQWHRDDLPGRPLTPPTRGPSGFG